MKLHESSKKIHIVILVIIDSQIIEMDWNFNECATVFKTVHV